MSTKRAASKARASAPPASAPSGSLSPVSTAVLIVSALAYGLWALVDQRALSWPPTELLAGLSTVAGCLALLGPILLWSRISGEPGGVGELVWFSTGVMLWFFNGLALVREGFRPEGWATSIGPDWLGPMALAVAIAGWRTGRAAGSWSWTNILGAALGLVWIAMALFELLPASASSRWVPFALGPR